MYGKSRRPTMRLQVTGQGVGRRGQAGPGSFFRPAAASLAGAGSGYPRASNGMQYPRGASLLLPAVPLSPPKKLFCIDELRASSVSATETTGMFARAL